MTQDEVDEAPEPSAHGWRRRLLGKQPSEVLAMPIVRYVQIKMTPQIANLSSEVARRHGMTREGWLRHIIATAIAAETPGTTVDGLLEGMPSGRIGERHRPERTRTP